MKLKDWHWNLIFIAAVSAMAVGINRLIEWHTGRYIVTDKTDQKISYRNISQPYDMHVMTFYGDTAAMTQGYYPFINVGDTLTGPAHVMNKQVVKSQAVMLCPLCCLNIIDAVNGKKLYELKKIARRDSLSRATKQKQR